MLKVFEMGRFLTFFSNFPTFEIINYAIRCCQSTLNGADLTSNVCCLFMSCQNFEAPEVRYTLVFEIKSAVRCHCLSIQSHSFRFFPLIYTMLNACDTYLAMIKCFFCNS